MAHDSKRLARPINQDTPQLNVTSSLRNWREPSRLENAKQVIAGERPNFGHQATASSGENRGVCRQTHFGLVLPFQVKHDCLTDVSGKLIQAVCLGNHWHVKALRHKLSIASKDADLNGALHPSTVHQVIETVARPTIARARVAHIFLTST
jgi:hypothetical protein